MRRLRRVGVRQWPRARFRRAALASVAIRPHGQEMSPAPLATPRASARRLHQSRGVPRSPRGHKNPRGSRLAVWVERARLRSGVARRAWGGASARATSRWIAIAAPDCAFRRPRRLQPTTLPVAALWWRHHTTPSREPHERSSYQSPCRHWPQGRLCRLSLPLSHQSAPATPARGSDRRQARRAAPEPSLAERRARRIATAAACAGDRAGRKGDTLSAPSTEAG